MDRQNWPYLALILLLASLWLPLNWLALLCLTLGRKCWLGWLLLAWCHWQPSVLKVHCHPRTERAEAVVEVTQPAQIVPGIPGGCRFLARVHHWTDRVEGPSETWLVQWAQGQASQIALGDRWLLQGWLSPLAPASFPGDFDARQVWQRRGVELCLRVQQGEFLRPAPPQELAHWRERLCRGMVERLPQPRAALLSAVVYGDASRLPPEISQDFRRSGTSHLLVASGTNVALLVGWTLGLGKLWGAGPVRSCALALWLIPLYVALTGASPSMLRAGVMGWLAVLARWTGHSLDLGRCLVLGSLGVLLWDRNYAYDLGFQLSLASVASLAWLAPLLQRWLPGPGSGLWASSLACSLGLLPFSWSHFQIFQPLAPLANLWMGPLVEGLLPLGLGLSLLDLVSPWASGHLAPCLDPWLWFCELSVHWWAQHSPQCPLADPGWPGWLLWGLMLAILKIGPGPTSLGLACVGLIPGLWRPSQSPRAQCLWLGGAPACWLHLSHYNLLLLQRPQQREHIRALDPLRLVVSLGDPPARWSLSEGWLELEPARLVYHHPQFRLGLVNREPSELEAALDRQGNLWIAGQLKAKVAAGQPWGLSWNPQGLWLDRDFR